MGKSNTQHVECIVGRTIKLVVSEFNALQDASKEFKQILTIQDTGEYCLVYCTNG